MGMSFHRVQPRYDFVKKVHSSFPFFIQRDFSAFVAIVAVIILLAILPFWAVDTYGKAAYYDGIFFIFASCIALVVYILQSYSQYMRYCQQKNSAARALLAEVAKNAKLVYDLRCEYLSNGSNAIVSGLEKSSKKIKKDFGLSLDTLIKLFKEIKAEPMSYGTDLLDSQYSKIESEIVSLRKKLDDDARLNFDKFIESKIRYPILSFNFEDTQTTFYLRFIDYTTYHEKRLLKITPWLIWYLDIMKYDFKMITGGLDWREKSPLWYIFCSIARVQYSKSTLGLLCHLVRYIIDDPEIEFSENDFNLYFGNMLQKLYYADF